jgi:hypothetical protein
MSRSKRISVLAVALTLCVLIIPGWGSSLQDYNPTVVVLALLLFLCYLNFFLPFRALELAGLIIIIVPALYIVLHSLCGLSVIESYLLLLRCSLALCFQFLLSATIHSYKQGSATTLSRVLVALAIPFLWSFALLHQSILFSLSLVVAAGLLWFYRRSLKKSG